MLVLVTNAHAQPSSKPPVWFVSDILCVHDSWHYTPTWHSGQGRAVYALFGHPYWRTWKTYGNGEGPWDASNYGYGGGLQMDATFQANYGSEFLARYGPAGGRWPVWVQVLVAWRGWNRQGWGAWPNTSRACGLR